MKLSALRKKLNLPVGDFIVAVHGIIHPSKGYDQMLKWWKNISLNYPSWKLLIIGGAGKEKWCREKISELGLINKVIMTGWLPNQMMVNEYLNAADCLLVTRRNTSLRPSNSASYFTSAISASEITPFFSLLA